MGNTCVVDMRHYLDEETDDLPEILPARVGAGVFEYRIDFGPGYRVYFGKDGDALVILLGGWTKTRQNRDIATAQARWKDYRRAICWR